MVLLLLLLLLLLLFLFPLHECRMSDINSRTRFFTLAPRPQIHRFFFGLARSHPFERGSRLRERHLRASRRPRGRNVCGRGTCGIRMKRLAGIGRVIRASQLRHCSSCFGCCCHQNCAPKNKASRLVVRRLRRNALDCRVSMATARPGS